MNKKFIVLALIGILALSVLGGSDARADDFVVIFSKNESSLDAFNELTYWIDDTEHTGAIHHLVCDLQARSYNIYQNDDYQGQREALRATEEDECGYISFVSEGGGMFRLTAVPLNGDEVTITSGPSGAPNPVESGGVVNCSVAAEDSLGHGLTYRWTARHNGEDIGTFDDATVPNPVWHAPVNSSGTTQDCEISVAVTCSEGQWTGGSYFQRVRSAAINDEIRITSGPAGTPNPVESGGVVNCSVVAEDSLGHALTYRWDSAAGTFDDASAPNSAWHAPANSSGATRDYEISVTVTCSEGQWTGGSYFQGVRSEASDEVRIIVGPGGIPNPVESGGTVNCSVAAEDSLGHSLTYRWTATHNGEDVGSFDDATVPNPVWHAPLNASGTTLDCEIGVTVTCSEGQSISASFGLRVRSSQNAPPVADAGDEQLVPGSALVTLDGCGSYDPDNSPFPLFFAWEQTGGPDVVELTATETCAPTFIAPDSSDVLEFTLTVSDGLVEATDTVTLTVDAQAPVLSLDDLAPYPDQGLDGNIGVSAYTCIRASVLDNMGIDPAPSSCSTRITAYFVYPDGEGERFEEIVGDVVFMETGPGLVWIMFVPDYGTTYDSGLPYGQQIAITIEACDLAGNSMEPYEYRFKVEGTSPDLPAQYWTEDPSPDQPGDTLSVSLEGEKVAGTWMEYLDTVFVTPFFGPTDEFPPPDEDKANMPPLNLQPPMFFFDPVMIFIPLPGKSNLSDYEIYRYEPGPDAGWEKAAVGDGWLEYREDHETSDPPMIEVWVNHFTGLLLSASKSDDGSSDSGSGGGGGGISSGDCFIATAAYGSANATDVLIFRHFRDKYLLTNLPGRLFVRTYYRLSPPLAALIAEHDCLRATAMRILSPLAVACKCALQSSLQTRRIVLAASLLVTALLLTALRFEKKSKHYRAP